MSPGSTRTTRTRRRRRRCCCWSAADEARHRQLTTRSRRAKPTGSASRRPRRRGSVRGVARAAREAATIALPVPVAHLAGGAPGNQTGRQFNGDEGEELPEVRTFARTDAFSLIVRQPTEAQDRAVIVHQSKAWTDAGSRGFELTLDRGRPFFGLIHFWPGNAVAVRAKTAAAARQVDDRDGDLRRLEPRRRGIAIYADGVPLDTDVVRDRLYKDITYSKARGDLLDRAPLAIGARFRDSGFKHGRIDDLRIFDVALTRAEVETLASAGPARTEAPSTEAPGTEGPSTEKTAAPPTLEQFVTRVYPPALALRHGDQAAAHA